MRQCMRKTIGIAIVTDKLNNQNKETNGYKFYKAATMSSYGVGTISLFGHQDKFDIIIKQADIIFMFGTILYPENIHQIEILSKMKKPGAKLVLWYFDACNPDFNHSKRKFEAIKSIIPYLNWLFTTDHSYLWEKEIKNYYHLLQGVYAPDYEKEPDYDKKRKFDVIFTGGLKGEFDYRQKLLDLIGRKYTIDIYGRNSGRRIYEGDFIEAYQNAKVALVPASPEIVNNQYWSNRIYLATATGTPCIVGYTPGIEKHFAWGKDVLFYENDGEMLTAIEYLINNPKEALKIGKNGRERTLKDHTYKNRFQEILKVIM